MADSKRSDPTSSPRAPSRRSPSPHSSIHGAPAASGLVTATYEELLKDTDKGRTKTELLTCAKDEFSDFRQPWIFGRFAHDIHDTQQGNLRVLIRQRRSSEDIWTTVRRFLTGGTIAMYNSNFEVGSVMRRLATEFPLANGKESETRVLVAALETTKAGTSDEVVMLDLLKLMVALGCCIKRETDPTAEQALFHRATESVLAFYQADLMSILRQPVVGGNRFVQKEIVTCLAVLVALVAEIHNIFRNKGEKQKLINVELPGFWILEILSAATSMDPKQPNTVASLIKREIASVDRKSTSAPGALSSAPPADSAPPSDDEESDDDGSGGETVSLDQRLGNSSANAYDQNRPVSSLLNNDNASISKQLRDPRVSDDKANDGASFYALDNATSRINEKDKPPNDDESQTTYIATPPGGNSSAQPAASKNLDPDEGAALDNLEPPPGGGGV
jgi:hypothetical protein